MTSESITSANAPLERRSFTWLDSADFRLAALRKLFVSGTSLGTEYGPAFLQMLDLLAEELQYARRELEDARREAQE